MFNRYFSYLMIPAMLVSTFYLSPAMAEDTPEPSHLEHVLSPETSGDGEIDLALHQMAGRIYSNFNYERPSETILEMASLSKASIPAYKQRAGSKAKPADAGLWNLRIAADAMQRPEMTSVIQQALQTGIRRASSCWDRVLLTRTVAQGSVLLSVVVRPDGSIERVQKLHDDINHDEFSKCLISAAQRLNIARAPGERITVTLPLSFTEK